MSDDFKRGAKVVVVNHRGELIHDGPRTIEHVGARSLRLSGGSQWTLGGIPHLRAHRGILQNRIRVLRPEDTIEFERRELAGELSRVDWSTHSHDVLRAVKDLLQ